MASLPIGHRIRARRKELGLTQTALAKRLELSVSYVNLIEHDKRSIGGKLLNRLAQALDLDTAMLSGTQERRLLHELEQIAAEPALAGIELDTGSARDLIARHEPWARALLVMRRTHDEDQRVIDALSNRLNHDPVLNGSVHEMLSAAAAIRSVADIYTETDDLEPAERARFDAILGEEAKRLSSVAQALVGVLEKSEAQLSGANASQEVDDFLIEHANHFPALEAFAATLPFAGSPETGVLAEYLRTRHRIRIEEVRAAELPGSAHRGVIHTALERRLSISHAVPLSTRRFEMARLIAQCEAGEAIRELAANAPMLASAAGEARAERALAAYAAAAILLPYEEFHATAAALRYDIDALAIRFGASPEQLCHRFTTLRRPGAEGVPFAMLRANAAGFLTKRFPLPRLPIPRYGGACPLWAIYLAMQTPDMRIRQIAEFPNGDRFFFIARATRPAPLAHGRSRPAFTLMLACDIVHADRLVYADGLDLGVSALADPVGAACGLCPRRNCAHRQEEPVRG